MRTRAEIVEMVRNLNVYVRDAVDTVDHALHERARALAKRPEKEAEWCLAWAVDNAAQAARRLNEACIDDVCRADRIRNQLSAGMRFSQDAADVRSSLTSACYVSLAAAQEALRRVLQVYEAMAVDVVDASPN